MADVKCQLNCYGTLSVVVAIATECSTERSRYRQNILNISFLCAVGLHCYPETIIKTSLIHAVALGDMSFYYD